MADVDRRRAQARRPALEPTTAAVVVEVRARTVRAFGDALESVDARKVARLYRGAAALGRSGIVGGQAPVVAPWRVDLVTLVRSEADGWTVAAHLRGLEPP